MNCPDILHHGAKDGVTALCRQLLMDTQHSPLIDCGLFQSAESAEGKSAAKHRSTELAQDTIKTLIAAHVRIDHVGRILYLLVSASKEPILCSRPSTKLLPIVLVDAFKHDFNREQKQPERYGKLIEQRIITLPYRTWLTLHNMQSRRCHDPKPPRDNEALQRVEHGNRSSGHRQRRERNVQPRSNCQLTEVRAARSAAQRSVRRLPGPRHRGSVHLGLWPARRLCRSGRAAL